MMELLFTYISGLLFPGLHWKIPSKTKTIFLTFDDGPHPVITPKVLNILDGYNAKATFFCVGANVQKYTEIYHQILKRGHRTGNHTYHHVKGWKTPLSDYMEDVMMCINSIQSILFRPPHGKMTPKQIKALKKEKFRIVMWTVLSKDYKTDANKRKLLRRTIRKTRPGSIIVFHDSEKAAENLMYILPKYLHHCKKKGYSFEIIQ